MGAENSNQTDKPRFVGEWARLGDVCHLLNGFAFKSKLYANDGIRVIRIANVQNGYLEDSMPCFYPWDLEKSIEKYFLEEDDLLISLTGNVGRVALVEKSFLPAALNQRVACLRIKNESYLRKRYLYHLLNSASFEDKCIKSANGIAQKNLSTEWVKDYLIPIPSLSTQDAVVNRLDLIQFQLTNARNSIDLLNSLIKSRFVEMFERQEYSKVPIGNLVISKMSLAKDTFGDTDPIRYIDISSIDNSMGEVMGFTEYVFGEAPSRAQQCIGGGDILVSTVRPNLKNVAVNKFDGDNLVASSGFCVLRCVGCSIEYMRAIVRSDRFTREMCQLTTGANYPAIKKRDVLEYMIPNPPMQQMNEFTVFVQQIDKLRFAIQEQIKKLETLKASLMQEYFG